MPDRMADLEVDGGLALWAAGRMPDFVVGWQNAGLISRLLR